MQNCKAKCKNFDFSSLILVGGTIPVPHNGQAISHVAVAP